MQKAFRIRYHIQLHHRHRRMNFKHIELGHNILIHIHAINILPSHYDMKLGNYHYCYKI